MRVLDTSAWIEWLIDSPAGRSVQAKVPSREKCLVPTVVQLELVKWLTRELGEAKADQVIAFTEKCVVIPLDTKLAIQAAEICLKHKMATADAIIYATTIEHRADLVTCDMHFAGLPGVILIEKVKS